MRAFLPLGIRAMPRMLNESRGRAQSAILRDRENCDAAARVVRDEHVLAGLVDDDVAGIGALRFDFIQKCQLASRAVDREGANAAVVWVSVIWKLIDGIQVTPRRMERYERRIGGFGGEPEGSDISVRGIETVGIDAFAVSAVLGVGADVEKIFI